MKKINYYLVRKQAKSASKAASLAIIVAGVFATSSMAFAQSSCQFVWGYGTTSTIYVSPGKFYDSGQLLASNVGSSGKKFNMGYQQSGNLTILSPGVGDYPANQQWPPQGTTGPVTLYPSDNVTLFGQVPSTATNGQFATVTITVGDPLGNIMCSHTVTVVVQGNTANHCSQKVTYYDGTQLTPTWDGANCYIKNVPQGATPFIWDNGYYVVPDKSMQCATDGGIYDLANCLFMTKPPGGYLLQDTFFVKAGPGNTCSLGTFNGKDCLVKTAPWGTHAFEYQLQSGLTGWYFSTLYTCKDGGYDGANCYIMKAPAGTKPFIWNNSFYYRE